MKKRKERNIDPSVYEDDSSDQDFNCAVIGGALKSLRRRTEVSKAQPRKKAAGNSRHLEGVRLRLLAL